MIIIRIFTCDVYVTITIITYISRVNIVIITTPPQEITGLLHALSFEPPFLFNAINLEHVTKGQKAKGKGKKCGK